MSDAISFEVLRAQPQLPEPRPVQAAAIPRAARLVMAQEMETDFALAVDPRYSEPVMFDFGEEQAYAIRYEALIVDGWTGARLPDRRILLGETRRDGQPLGRGVVRIDPSPLAPEREVPCVGFTQTDLDARRKGRGLRRLRAMNVLSLAAFGLPLHSSHDGMTEPAAQRLWGRLIQTGEAEMADISGEAIARFRA